MPTTGRSFWFPNSIVETPLRTAFGREQLSERELEILRLIGQGASNREIAGALFLAEGTIKNHVTNILGKLEVRDRTQAALKAKDIGLI